MTFDYRFDSMYNSLFFSLSNKEVHVDSYGFRHKFEEQSLLLHYLCQELAQHYLSQAGTYEEHQRRWTHFMRQHGKSIANHVIIFIIYFFLYVSGGHRGRIRIVVGFTTTYAISVYHH